MFLSRILCILVFSMVGGSLAFGCFHLDLASWYAGSIRGDKGSSPKLVTTVLLAESTSNGAEDAPISCTGTSDALVPAPSSLSSGAVLNLGLLTWKLRAINVGG